jgi:hypothetical protein
MLLSALPLCFYSQAIYIIDSSKVKLNNDIDSLTKDMMFNLKQDDAESSKLLNTIFIYQHKDLSDTIPLFFKQEKIMTYFIEGEYKKILDDAKDSMGSKFFEKMRADENKKEIYGEIFPKYSPYFQVYDDLLHDIIKMNTGMINDINKSDLNHDEKDFLLIYFDAIHAYKDLRNRDTEDIYHDPKRYVQQHENSPYNNFVESELHPQYLPTKFGVGISCFTEFRSYYGNISNVLYNTLSSSDAGDAMGGLALEIKQGKFRIEGDFLAFDNLTLPVPQIKTQYNYWTKINDTTITYSTVQASIQNIRITPSYTIFENRIIRLAPFIGISFNWYHLMVDDINYLAYSSTQSLTFGADLDLKIRHEHHYKTYTDLFKNNADNSYLFIKFSGGISPVLLDNNKSYRGTTTYFKISFGKFFQKTEKVEKKIYE